MAPRAGGRTPLLASASRPGRRGRNLALVEALRALAGMRGGSVAQVASAWVLAQGRDIVPLVGARRRDRVNEALGATRVRLGPDDLAAIEHAVPEGAAEGERHPTALLSTLDSDRRLEATA